MKAFLGLWDREQGTLAVPFKTLSVQSHENYLNFVFSFFKKWSIYIYTLYNIYKLHSFLSRHYSDAYLMEINNVAFEKRM